MYKGKLVGRASKSRRSELKVQYVLGAACASRAGPGSNHGPAGGRSSNDNVWAERYDRDLNDIFGAAGRDFRGHRPRANCKEATACRTCSLMGSTGHEAIRTPSALAPPTGPMLLRRPRTTSAPDVALRQPAQRTRTAQSNADGCASRPGCRPASSLIRGPGL